MNVGVMMGAAMTNKTQNILNNENIMRATERKVYFEVVEQHVHENSLNIPVECLHKDVGI